jgi:hypothetical protein
MRPVHLAAIIGAAILAGPALSAQEPPVPRESLPRVLRPSTPPTSGPVNPVARLIPGTRPDSFCEIQGNALTSTNGILTDATVRLRDARFGRIVDVTVTDKAGVFIFRQVSPGTYVIELVGPDGSVLAASQLLDVNAGDVMSAIVKLPFRTPFAGPLANKTSTAAIIAATAAASGVLATRVTGTDVSPRR